MGKICAFTGHRILYGQLDFGLLDRVIEDLIKNGYDEFLCGMAIGFDTACAESVIKFKQRYDIKLTACLPYAEQGDTFSEKSRKKHAEILQKCDKIVTLSEQYFSGCMHARDRYMVDNCDAVLCFLRRQKGGTFYTVSYARRQGKKVIEL